MNQIEMINTNKLIPYEKNPRINYCIEYNNAYEFGYNDGQMHKGGESPVAVMKETGEALNFISYAVRPGGGKIIREFDIK